MSYHYDYWIGAPSRVALPAAARTKSEELELVGNEYYATMMRAAAIVALALGAEAFLKHAAPKAATQLAAYVPSGMSKAEYEALKKKVRTRCEKIRTGLVKKSAPPAPKFFFFLASASLFFNLAYSSGDMPLGT